MANIDSILENMEAEPDSQMSIIRSINSVKHFDAINLGLGQVNTAALWLAPRLEQILQEGHDKLSYTANAGYPKLISALAEKYQLTKENVLVTCGVQNGIHYLFTLLQEFGAKKILLPEVAFGAYKTKANEVGLEVEKYGFNEDLSLNLNKFEQALRDFVPDIVVVNSPSNPTGVVFFESEMQGIATLLEANGSPFLASDEIYREFTDPNLPTAPSFLDYYNPERCIALDGVSKSGGIAGARVGWMVSGHRKLVQMATKRHATTNSSLSPLHQEMARAIVAGETAETILKYRETIFENRELMEVDFRNANSRIVLNSHPQGSIYAFPQVTDQIDTYDLCMRAARDRWGVAVIPGKAFGAPDRIRIALATNIHQLREGVRRLVGFVVQN